MTNSVCQHAPMGLTGSVKKKPSNVSMGNTVPYNRSRAMNWGGGKKTNQIFLGKVKYLLYQLKAHVS